ncbi:MAG: hypothetical protein ABSG25_06935 [Bryobacteraceae bacterium]
MNANYTFSLQEAGQSYRGTFTANGNMLELNISDTNTKNTATLQGNTLTDNSGQKWVLQGQSAGTANGAAALHNDDIIKMAKYGFGDAIIVAKIRDSNCQFDTSIDALIRLKQSNVSDAVVQLMVASGSGGSGPATAQASIPNPPMTGSSLASTGDPNDPLVPHDSGIYLFTKDRDGKPQMIVLERAAYQGAKTGGMFTSALTYGVAKVKTKAVIPGPRASIRVADPAPVFYFYFEDKAAGLGKSYFGITNLSSPNQFALLKLEVKKNNRETIISESNAFGASSGSDAKSMITFKSDRIRSGLYKVTVDSLQPGEYCFLASSAAIGAYGAGAAGAADIFDFGGSN